MTTLGAFLEEYPDVLKAINSLDELVRAVKYMEPAVAEMVFLRTSVVHGCAACVQKHSSSPRYLNYGPEVVQALLDSTVEFSAEIDPRLRITLRLVDALATSPATPDVALLQEARGYLSSGEMREIALIVAAASMLNSLLLSWTAIRPFWSSHISTHFQQDGSHR